LENEKILRQFEEVEKKVEKLIERCKSFEADNSKLTNKVTQLEQELQKKAEMENRNVEEKTFIRSKIDSLLAKLKEG